MKNKIKKLIDLIHYHEHKYYEENSPEISDGSFDKLIQNLRKLEIKYPEFILPNSPTQKVGGELSNSCKKYKHNPPLQSLDNSYNKDELYAFNKRVLKNLYLDFTERDFLKEGIEYVTELKIDGLGINLIYKNGVLFRGITRGNGKIGEDVTNNIKTMESIPKKIPFKKEWDSVEIRGEIFMMKSDFIKLNEERRKNGETEFANPRNAAAGAVRILNPKKHGKRKLNLFAYAMFIYDKNGKEIRDKEIISQYDLLKKLKALGMPIEPSYMRHTSINSVLTEISKWAKIRLNKKFDIDGIVVKVDHFKLQKELGSTSKFPHWAIAFKFAAEQTETTVNNIRIQVGRTGTLTPVAEFEPVFLAGSTISNASLHNEDNINKLDIRIGDSVIIEKAGDIIPQVVSVIKNKRNKKSKKFKMPISCPACNSIAIRKSNEARWYCTNKICPAILREFIIYFASKKGMDIDGLGPSIVDKLLENKLIKNASDIYNLNYNKVAMLNKMGYRSVEKLEKSIEVSKNRGLETVLHALGISNVGERTCKLLVRNFKCLAEIGTASIEDISKIHEIGNIAAKNIVKYFSNRDNIAFIARLELYGVSLKSKKEKLDKQTLVGKTFVITGTLDGMSRKEAKDIIVRAGGKVSGAVSSKTNYLLVGENAGSKLSKAQKLNITIISKNDIIKMLK